MLSANAVPKCKVLMITAKQPEMALHGDLLKCVWGGRVEQRNDRGLFEGTSTGLHPLGLVECQAVPDGL